MEHAPPVCADHHRASGALVRLVFVLVQSDRFLELEHVLVVEGVDDPEFLHLLLHHGGLLVYFLDVFELVATVL